MPTPTRCTLFATVLAATLLFVPCGTGLAQTIEVTNPSFEQGTNSPEGWTLSGGDGRWLEAGAVDGKRAIAVKGDGQNSNSWLSTPVAFEPSSVYCIRFQARSLGASGGTPTTGPGFCNCDLGQVPEEWKAYELICMSPDALAPEQASLHFGQWQVRGEVAYDNVAVMRVDPVYTERGGFVLGDGETVDGLQYTFAAPFYGTSHNQCRPLAYHHCHFNTNRWAFGNDSVVVYRHNVGGRNQTKAEVNVAIGYYQSGELVVEASVNGTDWRAVTTLNSAQGGAAPIPADLLPAKEVWIRLRAQAKEGQGPGTGPASLQVGSYGYMATLDGASANVVGGTRFVATEKADPRLKVTVTRIGDGVPGGNNVLAARIENVTAETVQAKPTVIVTDAVGQALTMSTAAELRPGVQNVEVPYEVPGTGEQTIQFTLGEQSAYSARVNIQVADLFASQYGDALPSPDAKVALWWTSSGWKISKNRPAPSTQSEALLIRLAQNEAEAAQLVLRPERPLKGFMAAASELAGPNNAKIPAENVEVLRVRYLNVTRPTDRVGVVAPWPDPLPPLEGAIDLAAGENHPLWIRVKAPRGVPAGTYTGTIHLKAEGFEAGAPLHVEVYGFELPDRMTCVTAFGFDAGLPLQYQKVTDPAQRREIVDKYLQNYSAHHISPYNLAPLDGYSVEWKGLGSWQGGACDTKEKHSGEASRFTNDNQPNANVSINYQKKMVIPQGGLRLRFWYKTSAPGHEVNVTLGHHDGNSQWMSGRNNDMFVQGDGTWQSFDRTITEFPEGAKEVALTLWAARYRDDGSSTGGIWYDDVSLASAATGEELLSGGGFEPEPFQPEAVFNWTTWDAAMTRSIDELHFNSFHAVIPGLGGGTFFSRDEPSFMGYPENTPEYKALMRAYCGTFQEHLREKGWLDEAFAYWFDEPDRKDYEFVMNGFRKLKEYCPGIHRMLTEQPEPELVGGPNIWCPVTPEYDQADADARRADGDLFWWYVCCGPKEPYCTLFIDHPATELRVWLWQTWQRNINGILVWQSNYWTSEAAYPEAPQNPYEDSMSWTSGYSTPAGTRLPWGNGDGRFVYPPEAAANGQQAETVLEGPVDSIRWEMLRDGIEDYEYLRMLRDLLTAKGDRLSASERSQYEDLLDVPDSITKDVTTFTKDPAPIEKRRHEVAQAIAALNGQ